MKTLSEWTRKFFDQTGMRAILLTIASMIVVAVPSTLLVLVIFLKIVSPLQEYQTGEPLTSPSTSTTLPPAKVFDFLVGEPKFFLEPTWGISGKPTLAVPVLVTNKTNQKQEISPTVCFSVRQEESLFQLKQFIPLGGEVSVGGIIPPEGSQMGWLYFENVDASKSSTFSARCEKTHELFTHSIPSVDNQ